MFSEKLFRRFYRAATLTALGFVLGATPRDAAAQNATSMAKVRTVFARRATGNAWFNARLRAKLQARGLQFVPTARGADAILDTSGQYVPNGFRGQMTFIGRGGRVLLREQVLRQPRSTTMAYQLLARKYRAPRK